MQTEQRHTQKQSCRMHPLLLETEATLMFQQMTYIDSHINFISVTCSPHNAKTTIGRYQRSNRLILIIVRAADSDCRPIISASTLHKMLNSRLYNIISTLHKMLNSRYSGDL